LILITSMDVYDEDCQKKCARVKTYSDEKGHRSNPHALALPLNNLMKPRKEKGGFPHFEKRNTMSIM